MLLILNLNHSIEKHLWENGKVTWFAIFRETEMCRFIFIRMREWFEPLTVASQLQRLESLDPVISRGLILILTSIARTNTASELLRLGPSMSKVKGKPA